MSKHNSNINTNNKPQYGIDRDLLNVRYKQFAEYYKIPNNEFLRDYFEPFVRICIYEGAPITGRNSAIPIDTIFIAELIEYNRIYYNKL